MAKSSDIQIMGEHLLPFLKGYIGQFTMDNGKPVTDFWDFDAYCHKEHDRWLDFMGFNDDDDE